MSGKPELKVNVKAKDGSSVYTVFAFWRNNGRLNGRMDNRLKSIQLTTNDGEVITVSRDDYGKETHWINTYENKSEQSEHEQQKKNGYQKDDDGSDVTF